MAAFNLLIKVLPAVLQGMVDALGIDVFNTYRQFAFAGCHECNSTAHQPTAEHTNGSERRRRSITSGIFFHVGTGKENAAQRLRLRRHCQLTKGFCLCRIATAAALRQTGFNHTQNAFSRRVVTFGFLLGFLANHIKQQSAPKRPSQNTLTYRQMTTGLTPF
ncbi:hypothetical protein D3C76_941020 [compost metagenome]